MTKHTRPGTGAAATERLDDSLRALSHPARRAIIRLTTGVDVPATELAERLGVAPATASEHLRVLRKMGLIELTATGTWRRYRAVPGRFDAVLDALVQDIRNTRSQ
jgi:DNA-binding transcriptional ArsR family regulator